jgi:predicted MFS family arabinose efflux permease
VNLISRPALQSAYPYLAVVLTGVIATGAFLILPILVGGLADEFGWGGAQVGWLAAADMGGSALASLVMAVVIAKLDWRKSLRIAIVLAIVGNLASIFICNLAPLLLVRAFTGICNGVVLSVVFASLCRSSNPDRYFGLYVFTQLGSQALLLPILPRVIEAGGISTIYIFLATASAASLLLVRFFPARFLKAENSALSKASDELSLNKNSQGLGILALLAQGLYFLAPAAIWGYFQSIGETFTLTFADVGEALGLASLAGIAGALLVIFMGNRFGRMWSMGAGTVVSILAVWVLMNESGFYWFLTAAALMNFSWNFTFPYQMGTLALFDRNGSIAVLSLLVQTFGLSFGPLLASFLLTGRDFSSILMFCMGCYAISLFLFFASSKLGERMKPGLT